MKAAILHTLGSTPQYGDFPDPVPHKHQELITMKAASVKNLDKLRASGTHYASYTEVPVIVGIDGVGILANGTRVYAQGLTGTIAEKALVQEHHYVKLPGNLDDAIAAALPNAVIGAAMALVFRAKMQRGETVLINGATGVTGQLAVQLARYYGAAKIIVTGRNAESLEKLKGYGANEILSLNDMEEGLIKRLKELHSQQPIDVVIDYLWGRPVELILAALKGGGINAFTHRVRLVTVGSMAGENITVASGLLRSSAVELLGSGIGSLSQEEMMKFGSEILPEMFQLAADGELSIETELADLKDIEAVWNKAVAPGKRLVIRI